MNINTWNRLGEWHTHFARAFYAVVRDCSPWVAELPDGVDQRTRGPWVDIGYAGGYGHDDSFEEVQKALVERAEKYSETGHGGPLYVIPRM